MNITWGISSIMIHQIFLLAHDWYKHFTLTNITYLKLGDIHGYPPKRYSPIFKPCDKSSFKIQFKLKERLLFVTDRQTKGKYLFFVKSSQRTLKKNIPRRKKQFSIFNFPFHIPIPNSPCPTLHSTFPFPTPSPIPQSHSPLPISAFSNIVLCKGHVI